MEAQKTMGMFEETPPFIFVDFIVFQILTLAWPRPWCFPAYIFLEFFFVSKVQIFKYIFK